jgi:hypothetical protein
VAYPVMVSDGVCDHLWIRWYFSHFHVPNPFRVPGYNASGNTLDMKSMLVGKHGIRWAQTRRAEVLKAFPEYRNEYDRTHNALSDAIEQAERFQRMRGVPA